MDLELDFEAIDAAEAAYRRQKATTPPSGHEVSLMNGIIQSEEGFDVDLAAIDAAEALYLRTRQQVEPRFVAHPGCNNSVAWDGPTDQFNARRTSAIAEDNFGRQRTIYSPQDAKTELSWKTNEVSLAVSQVALLLKHDRCSRYIRMVAHRLSPTEALESVPSSLCLTSAEDEAYDDEGDDAQELMQAGIEYERELLLTFAENSWVEIIVPTRAFDEAKFVRIADDSDSVYRNILAADLEEFTCLSLQGSVRPSSVNSKDILDLIEELSRKRLESGTNIPFTLYNLTIEAPPSFYQLMREHSPKGFEYRLRSMLPDFVIVSARKNGRTGLKIELTAADVKMSTKLRPYHIMQVLLYTLTLEHLVAQSTAKDVEWTVSPFAEVWRPLPAPGLRCLEISTREPASTNSTNQRSGIIPWKDECVIDTTDLNPLRDWLYTFMFHDIPRMLENEGADWLFQPACRGCEFESTCRADSEGTLAEIPFLSRDVVSMLRQDVLCNLPNSGLTDIEDLDAVLCDSYTYDRLQLSHPQTHYRIRGQFQQCRQSSGSVRASRDAWRKKTFQWVGSVSISELAQDATVVMILRVKTDLKFARQAVSFQASFHQWNDTSNRLELFGNFEKKMPVLDDTSEDLASELAKFQRDVARTLGGRLASLPVRSFQVITETRAELDATLQMLYAVMDGQSVDFGQDHLTHCEDSNGARTALELLLDDGSIDRLRCRPVHPSLPSHGVAPRCVSILDVARTTLVLPKQGWFDINDVYTALGVDESDSLLRLATLYTIFRQKVANGTLVVHRPDQGPFPQTNQALKHLAVLQRDVLLEQWKTNSKKRADLMLPELKSMREPWSEKNPKDQDRVFWFRWYAVICGGDMIQPPPHQTGLPQLLVSLEQDGTPKFPLGNVGDLEYCSSPWWELPSRIDNLIFVETGEVETDDSACMKVKLKARSKQDLPTGRIMVMPRVCDPVLRSTRLALLQSEQKDSEFLQFIEGSTLFDAAAFDADTMSANVGRITNAIKAHRELEGVQKWWLNAQQLSAIDEATKSRVTLIGGPPGTGKTRLMCYLVLTLAWARLTTDDLNRTFRVVVTGPTNSCMDEFVKRLNDLFAEFNDKLLELGLSGLPKDIRQAVVCRVSTANFKQHQARVKEWLKGNRQKFFVLAVTPSVAKRLGDTCMAFQADAVLFDEASQARVFQACAPFNLAKRTARFIIAGDRHQLAPVGAPNPGDLPATRYAPLALPLILYTELCMQNSKRKTPIVWLKEAFRSAKPIVKALNHIYKDLESVSGGDRSSDASGVIAKHMLSEPGSEQWDSLQAAKYEAEYVAKLVNKTISDTTKELTIFCITPHVQQKLVVRRCLELLDMAVAQGSKFGQQKSIRLKNTEGLHTTITVDTVDAVQGSEAEIVILCYSFFNAELIRKRADFLFDYRRLNVAFSRAKDRCILVTTEPFLRPSPEAICDPDRLRALRFLQKIVEVAASENITEAAEAEEKEGNNSAQATNYEQETNVTKQNRSTSSFSYSSSDDRRRRASQTAIIPQSRIAKRSRKATQATNRDDNFAPH